MVFDYTDLLSDTGKLRLSWIYNGITVATLYKYTSYITGTLIHTITIHNVHSKELLFF